MKIKDKDFSHRMVVTDLGDKETSYKPFDSERKPNRDGPGLEMSEVASESGAGTSRKEKPERMSIVGGLNLSIHIDNLLKSHVDKTGIGKARELFIPGLDESPLDLSTSRNKKDNLDPMARLES